MRKNFLRALLVMMIAAFIFESPSAFAIFGIRAARAAIAARKAKQMTSSSEPSPEEAYAQEKARFEKPAHANPSAKSKSSNTLKNEGEV